MAPRFRLWRRARPNGANGWAVFALAWLLFETITGLAIYLLPFSVANQWTTVVHTVVGLLALVPALAYQIRHLGVYWNRPRNAIKVMGYLASTATLVAVISGLVLTAQALFGRRISYAWGAVHVISTFALVAFALPHVLVLLIRDRTLGDREEVAGLRRAERRALWSTATWTAALAAPILVLCMIWPGERLNNEFPADYALPYGPDRPFAPSLARTATNRAFDSRALSGSESCGTAGCHEAIVAEWRVSAHRWAAMDPGFQRIQEEMARQNGSESTRYCGGCHDPISLFSGAKTTFNDRLTGLTGYQEGVSCLACHSIRKTDLAGNANYIVARPSRYLFEMTEGRAARMVRDFLIRSYPRQHVADLSKRLFKTAEYLRRVPQAVHRPGGEQCRLGAAAEPV